ncbi:MAG TPA: molybdopterin-guanine dinucleotide biosynthesis protein B [Proteobacteria bacterium]|nr:molybdopterin-guanine dinucleotide biosynthesis protein B [Pseudomonadota bacterium]
MKQPRAVAIVGPSKSGKTALIERLIVLAKSRGLKVAAVKHAPQGVELDRPNSDSDRMFASGADAVAIVGEDEAAIRTRVVPDVPSILGMFRDCDLVLFEGFKGSGLAKIELIPQGEHPLDPPPSNIVARVSDSADSDVPRFSSHQIDELLEFILKGAF